MSAGQSVGAKRGRDQELHTGGDGSALGQASRLEQPNATESDDAELNDEERDYKRQKLDYTPIPLLPQEEVHLDHRFNPNHDFDCNFWELPPKSIPPKSMVLMKMRHPYHYDQTLVNVKHDVDGNPTLTKHPRWYLPSGDVIFNVENVLFRLHANHVGKHLLGLTRSIEDAELINDGRIDDIPVLNCKDANVLDWALMCQMLYWPVYFFRRRFILFDEIVRLLRLSRTFKSLHLRSCAIAALTQLFPSTLDQYLRKGRNNCVYGLPPAFIIHTINLCAEHDIVNVLLMAMLSLSDYHPTFILFGIDDVPGTEVKLENMEIAVRILRGRQELMSARHDVVLAKLKEVPSFDLGKYRFSEGCKGGYVERGLPPGCWLTCAGYLRTLLTTYHQFRSQTWYGKTTDRPTSAFAILRGEHLSHKKWTTGLCPSCACQWKVEMKKGQRALWRKLPGMFGMYEWFELAQHSKRVVKSLQEEYTGVRPREVVERLYYPRDVPLRPVEPPRSIESPPASPSSLHHSVFAPFYTNT